MLRDRKTTPWWSRKDLGYYTGCFGGKEHQNAQECKVIRGSAVSNGTYIDSGFYPDITGSLIDLFYQSTGL